GGGRRLRYRLPPAHDRSSQPCAKPRSPRGRGPWHAFASGQARFRALVRQGPRGHARALQLHGRTGVVIVIGLTGSIGMGKSTAAGMMAEMGIPVHDADACVHELTGPNGKAVAPVGALCPEAVTENEKGEKYIDRKVLGKAFF